MQDNFILRYKYWRNFLLLSENYKILCESINSIAKQDPLPTELTDWVLFDSDGYDLYLDWLERNQDKIGLDHIFENSEWEPKENMTVFLYPLFQDIFHNNFSDVKHRLQLFEKQKDNILPKPITNGRDEIARLLDSIYWMLKRNKNQEPRASELIKETIDWIDENEGKWEFIKLEYFNHDVQSLKILFEEYLKGHFSLTRSTIERSKSTHAWRIYIPEGYFGGKKPDYFDTYLEAYKLHKIGISIRDSLPKLFGKKEVSKWDSNQIKMQSDRVRRDIKTATQLVMNAESTNFPGEYSERSEDIPRPERTSQHINFNYKIE